MAVPRPRAQLSGKSVHSAADVLVHQVLALVLHRRDQTLAITSGP